MGNRAVITIEGNDDEKLGVYLHWNGGRDSVSAFLMYCKMRGFRPPEVDCYGWARLCQVIGNFFGGDLSIGVDRYQRLDADNFDNGVYIIKNWEIIGRKYYEGMEQDYYKLTDMIKDVNKCQPYEDQLSEEAMDKWFKENNIDLNS